MKFITIIHRRLKEGKTFDDYRKAWFHACGFGAPTTMYTVVNAFDPGEIISVAVGGGDGGTFEEMKSKMAAILDTDVRERRASPLDQIETRFYQRSIATGQAYRRLLSHTLTPIAG